MQGGVSCRPPHPSAPPFPAQYGQGPHGQPPPHIPLIAVTVASSLAQQDEGMHQSVTYMDDDARRRVIQSRDNRDKEGAKRQETRQNVDTRLATPLVSAPQPAVVPIIPVSAPQSAAVPITPDADPVDKRKHDTETEGARGKRKVEINLGEEVQRLPLTGCQQTLWMRMFG